mgnify:CR=1 FL=1
MFSSKVVDNVAISLSRIGQKAPNVPLSVNVQLPHLRRDLRAGSISRDVANFPSELRRRSSGMFWEFKDVVFEDVVFDNNTSVTPF